MTPGSQTTARQPKRKRAGAVRDHAVAVETILPPRGAAVAAEAPGIVHYCCYCEGLAAGVGGMGGRIVDDVVDVAVGKL